MKKTFAQIMGSLEDDIVSRVTAKVPEWAGVQGLKVPGRLCAEQCSRSAAAAWKAELALGACGEGARMRIADGTGGLGVDSWHFSRLASEVLYFERSAELCAAAESNFRLLGAGNIRCLNLCFGDNPETREALSGFRPDIIYLDPARRSASGSKVFLLEDCEPDVTALMPVLWEFTDRVLLKVSPMADIPMLRSRLGERLTQVHAVSVGGEVKELLLLLEKDGAGSFTVTATDCRNSLRFTPQEEKEAQVTRPVSRESFKPGTVLFDPDPALTKAGAFKLISGRLGAAKAGTFTHLYLSAEPLPFGRNYAIADVLPLDKRSIAQFGARYPGADVTARNIPMKSEELRARLNVKKAGTAPDGPCHIFAFTADYSDGASERLLVAARPLI